MLCFDLFHDISIIINIYVCVLRAGEGGGAATRGLWAVFHRVSEWSRPMRLSSMYRKG